MVFFICVLIFIVSSVAALQAKLLVKEVKDSGDMAEKDGEC